VFLCFSPGLVPLGTFSPPRCIFHSFWLCFFDLFSLSFFCLAPSLLSWALDCKPQVLAPLLHPRLSDECRFLPDFTIIPFSSSPPPSLTPHSSSRPTHHLSPSFPPSSFLSFCLPLSSVSTFLFASLRVPFFPTPSSALLPFPLYSNLTPPLFYPFFYRPTLPPPYSPSFLLPSHSPFFVPLTPLLVPTSLH